jgi:hypothetical protein
MICPDRDASFFDLYNPWASFCLCGKCIELERGKCNRNLKLSINMVDYNLRDNCPVFF